MSQGAVSVPIVLRWLLRGALLAAWTVVGWGTLLLLVALVNAVERGPRLALAVLLPTAGGTVWDWLNGFAAALALVSWLLVAGLVVLARWPARRDPREATAPETTARPVGGEDTGGDRPAAPE